MLEYSLDEAEQLLKKNLDSAESSVQQIAFDLDFLRDQMTITEVSMARLYTLYKEHIKVLVCILHSFL